MIKAIMTDLDGVIRHWNNQDLFSLERENNLEEGLLFSHAFNEQFLIPAIIGEVTHGRWLAKQSCCNRSKTARRI